MLNYTQQSYSRVSDFQFIRKAALIKKEEHLNFRHLFYVTVHSPYIQTNAGQLPALQTHARRDHV